MSLTCKIFGHKDEAINFWGEQAEYILFRCNRCSRENIHCSHEMRQIPNDEFGMKVLHKMMTDSVFSNACRVHSEFVSVENDNLFSIKKREKGYKMLREKYGLPDNYRPACPVVMFKSGLWIDESKPNKKPRQRLPKIDIDLLGKKIEDNKESNTSKGEFENQIIYQNIYNMDNKDNIEYTNEVQVVEYEFENKPTKESMIAELEKLEKIYAEKENYEKAAEIFERIQILKGKK